MIPVLYEKNVRDFGYNNGLGSLPDWISIEVVEERNGEFYLQGELPVDGVHVDKLAIDRIIYAAAAPGELAQPFRILKIDKPEGSNTVQIMAPHVSYQLTQTVILPYLTETPPTYQYCEDAMDYLFGRSFPSMEGIFYEMSDIEASSAKPVSFTETVTLRNALFGAEGSLVDLFGGEMRWEHWIVRILASRGTVTNKVIRYGENLSSLSFDTDATSLVTAYIGYITMPGATVRSNMVYVTGYNAFAYPRVEALDLTEQYQDAEYLPTTAQLTTATEAAVADKLGAVNLRTSIVVEAVPDTLQDLKLCDTVTVLHPGYNLQQSAKIVKTVFDPIKEKYTSLTIGEIRKSIADTLREMLLKE